MPGQPFQVSGWGGHLGHEDLQRARVDDHVAVLLGLGGDQSVPDRVALGPDALPSS